MPLLGDIPVLGYLFKNKITSDVRSTLIVLITPSLIRSAQDTNDTMQRVLRERFEMRQRLMEQRDEIFGTKQGD